MKKLISLLLSLLLFLVIAVAQVEVPQGFTYQGVARNSNGKLLDNQQLQVKISLYASGSTNMFYGESHTVTTNRFGVFVLIVGQGTRYGGLVLDLKSVDFKNNQVDIKSEIQIAGAWETVGQQTALWSVPYALVAQKVIENDDADADPTNEIQAISIVGSTVSLSKNGGTITIPSDADGDPTNEIQDLNLNGDVLKISNNANATNIDLSKYTNTDAQSLSLNGTSLSISNANTITLPTDNDKQSLSITNNQISISNGNTITLPAQKDTSVTNEIQDLSLNGDILKISNNANATNINLSKYTNTDNQTLLLKGLSLSISNGNTVNLPPEKDSSNTNEIQDLNLNGDVLSITKNANATNIDLSKYTNTDAQTLSLNGTSLSINNGNTVTLPTDNDKQSLSIIDNQISISNGNTITLPAQKDTSATNEIQDLKLTGDILQITNNTNATTIDLSKYNKDAQTLSLDGDSLFISNGNKVRMPTSLDEQHLKLDGTQLSISNGNFVDLQNILPAGMIIPFAGEEANIPDGWLLCNGAPVSATKYPRLFLAIGSSWGGSGMTFNLPDLRGRFLRGMDNGTGRDPDATSRTASNTGGNTGDKVGSVETDIYGNHSHVGSTDAQGNHVHAASASAQGNHNHGGIISGGSHTHPLTFDVGGYLGKTGGSVEANSGIAGGVGKRWGTLIAGNTEHTHSIGYDGNHTHVISIGAAGSHTHNVSVGTSGGSETRPKNAYVLYIIKY